MHKQTITVELSKAGIQAAIREVRQYKAWFEEKRELLIRKLAEEGLMTAHIRFAATAAAYDAARGGADWEVVITPTENGKGWTLRASGEDICFLEFGAGVTHGSNYPGRKPLGVIGIGLYGKGQGANPNGWYFRNAANEPVHTLGNAPAAAMYYAEETIRRKVIGIAKEVFV